MFVAWSMLAAFNFSMILISLKDDGPPLISILGFVFSIGFLAYNIEKLFA